MITFTEEAAKQIKSMIQEPETEKGLRVYAEPGGCSGLQYGMVFDDRRTDDEVSEQHGLTVLVDPLSLPHVTGAVVDYVSGPHGAGFRIHNPNAKCSCSCGESCG